jgi:hypothetical protein
VRRRSRRSPVRLKSENYQWPTPPVFREWPPGNHT